MELLLLLLVCAAVVADCAVCPRCGNTEVPYPLSTAAACGQPSYGVTCDTERNVLVFPAQSGNHDVLSIDPPSRTLIMTPAAIVDDSCSSTDVSNDGFRIDPASPFSLTTSNTILMFNCSQALFLSPLNCSADNACHKYLNQATGAPSRCASAGNICCIFNNARRSIEINYNVCSAYVSVVGLNESERPDLWKYGMQLSWPAAPLPACTVAGGENLKECGMNSECVAHNSSGGLVCQCNPGFTWDSFNGSCIAAPCSGKGCSGQTGLIAGLSAGIAVAMTAAVFGTVWYRRRLACKRKERERIRELSEMLAAGSSGRLARVYTAREMRRATAGFAQDRLLGSGGFGEVYLGKLDDGSVVAVKMAKIGNIKGTEQVVNEVRILSQVNHRNLVRLLGCCVEMAQPLLVYEYVPNGTLYDHLSGAKGPQLLDWRTRLQIALQTAEGLAYLHSAAYPPIYHRDVKSSNILLDQDLNVKVADFGLSRLASLDLTHVSTCAQGTLGYLDPEYYRNYQLTDKSDVYSFGVVLLELVTSQRAIDFGRDQDDVNLAIFAFGKQELGCLLDVADPRLKETSWPTTLDTILATALLALSCLQPSRVDRPAMKEVAEELQVIIGIEESGEKVAAHNWPTKPLTWTVSDLSDCD